MILRHPWGVGLCASVAVLTAGSAGAQTLRFHAEGGAARAVSGTQESETGLGWTAGGAIELGLGRAIGAQLELSAVTLSGGDAPANPDLAARGSSSGQALTAGLRARPFAAPRDGKLVSASGIWLDVNGGAARTGDLTRGAFDAHLGFDFMWEKFGAGPYVGYLHIFQPDDTLRPDDAHIALAGIHATFGGAEPERDRDGDGIVDSRDKCPDDPEDKDGFEDLDGCPDPDNDKDGVRDLEDACPNTPGKRTTDPKTNGCPVGDRDHDSVLDDVDRCPDEPEDKDGFWDEDGCPDPDNDKDGIPDITDKCPNEAETMNGYADDDGCPDDVQVRVVGDKILLDDRIHFDTNRSIVLLVSQPLLWRVAQIIIRHPEYTSVEVEGYADERGEEAYNQRLSEARAKSVLQLLVRYGVSRERLSSIGFGKQNPRVAEKSGRAYYQNRRVEFRITREKRDILRSDAVPTAPKETLAPPPPSTPPVEKESE
ncbi:MAG TPA: OmpA family protein [Polyangiaceae bacterium]|nr:OmpA family protein [Polyangiaceae bacterium]